VHRIRIATLNTKGSPATSIIINLAEDGMLEILSTGPLLTTDVMSVAAKLVDLRSMIDLRRAVDAASVFPDHAQNASGADANPQAKMVEEWNGTCPPGTEVHIAGESAPAYTLGKARVENGSAVVDVVEHVQPIDLPRCKATSMPPYVQALLDDTIAWELASGEKEALDLQQDPWSGSQTFPVDSKLASGLAFPPPVRPKAVPPLAADTPETPAPETPLKAPVTHAVVSALQKNPGLIETPAPAQQEPPQEAIAEANDAPVRHAAGDVLPPEVKTALFGEVWKMWPLHKKRDRAEKGFMESVQTAGDADLFAKTAAAVLRELREGTYAAAESSPIFRYTFFSTWREHATRLGLGAVQPEAVAQPQPAAAPQPLTVPGAEEESGENDQEEFGSPDPTPLPTPNPYRIEHFPAYVQQRKGPFRVIGRKDVGTANATDEILGYFATTTAALAAFPGASCAPENHSLSARLERESAAKAPARTIDVDANGKFGLFTGFIPVEPFYEYLDQAIAENPATLVTAAAREFAEKVGRVTPPAALAAEPVATAPAELEAGVDADEDMCTCKHIRGDHNEAGMCLYSNSTRHCQGFHLARRAVTVSENNAAPAAVDVEAIPDSVIDANPFTASGQPFGIFHRDQWPRLLAWPPSANKAFPRGTPPPLRAFVSLSEAIKAHPRLRLHVTDAASSLAANLLATGPKRRIEWSGDSEYPFELQEERKGRWVLMEGIQRLTDGRRRFPGVLVTERAKAEASAANLWDSPPAP
jgi:hypothetical protein